MVEQVDASKAGCDAMDRGAHTGAGLLAGLVTPRGNHTGAAWS